MNAQNRSHPSAAQTAGRRPSRRAWAFIAGSLALALVAGAGVWVAVANGRGPAETRGVLDPATTMGGVEIHVADLDRVREFYEEAVGLSALEEGEGRVVLGSDDGPLITLEQESGLPLTNPSEAGLFHSAIVFPTATDLAATLDRLARTAPERYQGSADHAVSLAFYFGDPEGNGLELYLDRPRDEWVWEGDRVVMGSEALDPQAFITENLGEGGAAGARMGHVHLRVGDATRAREFYNGVLGFDVTAEERDAVFLSAGGYHHHLAANAWNSGGAGARTPGLGLVRVTVHLASAAELAAAEARIEEAGLPVLRIGGDVLVDDPWGNTVRLSAARAA